MQYDARMFRYPLILASQSPRRREILTTAGIDFTVRVSPVEEIMQAGETPEIYVKRLAQAKAAASSALSSEPQNEIVLAADTVVVLDQQVLEKPHDPAHARRMLTLLSGRDHQVITGVAIRYPAGGEIREVVDTVATRVTFAPLNEQEIADYSTSGEPMDKAGGYAIQGLASKFVTRIDGCFFNVVGLPISYVYRCLQELRRDVT